MARRSMAARSQARHRPASGAPSRLLSIGAMLFAGTLLVGLSVPANAFMPSDAAVIVPQKTVVRGGQALVVSADAAASGAARDGFEVLSYAQVLALKYAAVDYSYTATSGAVRWPFPYPVRINDGFGPRSDGFHKGMDMMAGMGTPIYAIADGVATVATFAEFSYGQYVVLTHDLGGVSVESLYAHMISGSSPIVQGQQVKVGDYLGLVGDTGYTTAPHLHFEIHIDRVPVDPFVWLQANAV